MKNIKATIDIGSNSFQFLIFDFEKKKTLHRQVEVTGLGRGLTKSTTFFEEAKEDTIKVFKSVIDVLKDHNILPEKVMAVATEASRVASDSVKFFESIKNVFGIDVKIIKSETESYLSSFGIAKFSNINSQFAMLDIGGASTEVLIANGNPFNIIESVSYPIGSVLATEWLMEKNFNKMINEVIKKHSFVNSKQIDKLYCVAGTMTSIANIYLQNKNYVEEEVNGLSLNFDKLNKLINGLCLIDPTEILEMYPFLGKRSRVIHGGLKTAEFFLNMIKPNELVVSTYGLIHGLACFEKIDPKWIYKS
jgi:exopolyphosphatase/guanosine-5'-triphosphate,3'-diphosphate pyrophosphatase